LAPLLLAAALLLAAPEPNMAAQLRTPVGSAAPASRSTLVGAPIFLPGPGSRLPPWPDIGDTSSGGKLFKK